MGLPILAALGKIATGYKTAKTASDMLQPQSYGGIGFSAPSPAQFIQSSSPVQAGFQPLTGVGQAQGNPIASSIMQGIEKAFKEQEKYPKMQEPRAVGGFRDPMSLLARY